MRCEICGVEIRGTAYKVVIDGATLIACRKCALRNPSAVVGYVSPQPRTGGGPRRATPRVPVVRRMPRYTVVEEIVDDYAERIKEARERMGLTREVLAAMIGEKVSTIRRIESGRLAPTIQLARKLERVLKIKLVEVHEEGEEYGYSEGGEEFELTLGDIVEFKE